MLPKNYASIICSLFNHGQNHRGGVNLEYAFISIIGILSGIMANICSSRIKLGETQSVSPTRFSIRISMIQSAIFGILVTIVFLLVLMKYDMTTEGYFYMLFVFCLMIASYKDSMDRILPKGLNLLIGISGIYAFFYHLG